MLRTANILIFALTLVLHSNCSSIHSSKKLPNFGREMREEFLLDPNYISLNHGAFGTYPKAVQTALRSCQDRSEANADLWIRRDAEIELGKVRTLLAELINCDAEDLVVIPNATSGINAIFRSMVFQFGDKILHFNTIYFAMRSLIQYIKDYSNGNVTSVEFQVNYPMTNDQLVENFEEFIKANLPIRIALVDHISSSPSVINPLERLIPIMRKYNISILIDGAHAIGQIPIDIKALAPDYYVTNCHKWLYAARGCSMIFVEKSLQGSVHPTSISSNYAQPARYQDEFLWTGTIDYCPYMTVPAAIQFRNDLGGEEVVRNYTHNLALSGGKLLSQRFGNTTILQSEELQFGNMIDVQLPITNPDDQNLTNDFWMNVLFENNIFAAAFKHNGLWWVRTCAQIYTDLSDYETVAGIFLRICSELNNSHRTSSSSSANSLHNLLVQIRNQVNLI